MQIHLTPDDTDLGEDPVTLSYTLRLQDGIDVYTLSHGLLVFEPTS